tara:strand:- start:601 stop:1158 length:558 start_codon:yes stop_codon:yes gene_type:complete
MFKKKFYFILMTFEKNESYQFYKKYHKNKINKIIHIFCIPLIVWSFSVLLHSIIFSFSTNILVPSGDLSNPFNYQQIVNINLNLSGILLSLYLIAYSIMDNSFFRPMLFFLSFIWCSSYYFLYQVTSPYLYAILINIFSWIMQFIGHGIFEGNRPALIDSIIQSFLMAPLFSYLEFKEVFCCSKT